MDYRKCATEIFEKVGKRENLISAAHCATRLRLVTKDNSKVDMDALENIDGVKGVFSSNGQLQLIIGTGTVNKVYDEFLDVSGMSAATKDDVKAAAAAKQPLIKRMVKALGDVFVPILPAIVATGLMMGLVEALGKAIPAFAATDWYAILDMISNTAFTFLPILVAVSAARVFGGNIFLGALIGMIMIHPNLLNAWAVSTADSINVWHLIGDVVTVKQVGYQGHVIPVVIAVWIMCWIEKKLHKVVPEVLDLFVVPLVTVLVTAFLTLVVIGPIFSTLENYVLDGAQWLIKLPFGIGAMVMGAIYPLTVVCGLHHMYNVIELGMLSNNGLNTWMPIASAANFAQCAACLAVAVKTRQAKTKTIAIPSALSASLGITEPAIFGVNLRLMKPLICGMVGGAAGAAFGAIMNIGATSNGVTGIPGLLITTNCTVKYVILLVISFTVAFALTMVFYKDGEGSTKKTKNSDETKKPINDTVTEQKEEAIECEARTIYTPMTGKVIPMADIPDPTFSAGILGDGVGIVPTLGEVRAPFDGKVTALFDTKHAIGMTSKDGVEMLIHVGLNTVELGGKFYEALVKDGDEIKAGQTMIKFDIAEIKKAGYDVTTAVLITNAEEIHGEVKVEYTGDTKKTAKLLTV